MKKIFFYLVLTLFVGQIAAQSRIVQGIERPDLQNKSSRVTYSTRTNTSFTLDSIDFWVGDGENRAALVVSWHDAISNMTDHLVWGYRWPADTDASGYQMINAVAQKDPRFLLLTQFTSPSAADTLGYTIDGIGYDVTSRSNIQLNYVLGQEDPFIKGASTDNRVFFKFDVPNVSMGQTKCPTQPLVDANAAIATGQQTGVITHPFDSKEYGYPCYDYDYWQVSNQNAYWKAGWYDGYWSYFVRNNNKEDFGYSFDGASRRTLSDGCWDGWSYNGDMNNWEGTQPGDILTAAPAIVKMNIKSITLNVGATLPLKLTIDKTYTSGDNVAWNAKSSIVRITGGSDQGATITARAVGKAYVRATINGYNAFCDITVVNPASKTVTGEILYSNNTLNMKNLKGHTAYISSINGSVVSTYQITSDNETKSLNLTSGIYSITAVKGTEKVSAKFVVR